MPIIASKVTLSTTPLRIARGIGGGDHVTCFVRGATATVFLGGATVDSTNGFPLTTSDSFSIDLINGDDLYAVASTGAPTIQVLAARQ